MKGERLQSLSDMCTKPLPSLSFIPLLLPERKRGWRQRDREERAESKTITLWVLSPIKEEKSSSPCFSWRADALQWSMDLTVEDITMSLIETSLQGLLWGSCFVKPPSNTSLSSLRTFVAGSGCYGGKLADFHKSRQFTEEYSYYSKQTNNK